MVDGEKWIKRKALISKQTQSQSLQISHASWNGSDTLHRPHLARLFTAYITNSSRFSRHSQNKVPEEHQNNWHSSNKMFDIKPAEWCLRRRHRCRSSVTLSSFSYNTWPLMNGQVIPDGIIAKDKPFWKNFFENVPMVQFNHRTMAYITMSVSYHLLYKILKARIGGPFTVAGLVAVFMINYQAFSGIMVLLDLVPRQKANVHQMTAVLTITSVLLMVYLARVPLPPI